MKTLKSIIAMVMAAASITATAATGNDSKQDAKTGVVVLSSNIHCNTARTR